MLYPQFITKVQNISQKRSSMTEPPIASKQGIRSFQQKIINRSITDLKFFENLADYLLQCCSAQAKANTLSFCSLLPILITSILISGPSRFWFLFSAISLLLHQILDIANKKQAYRLQSFSFGTYYFDHTCDTVSIMLIVYIIGTLFQIQHNWLWFLIFLFGAFPFYIHHLTMYYAQYMCFPTISPATEGLLLLQIICFIGFFSPTYLQVKFTQNSWFGISELIVAFALLWLIVFIIQDIRDIIKASNKFNQSLPLKNLFVIFVIGYVTFEGAVIQPSIMNNSSITFGLYFYSLILCFTMIIGQLLLKYASNEKFQQISANTLGVTAFFAFVYAIYALGNLESSVQDQIGFISSILLAIGQTIYSFLRSRTIMRFINEAINQ